MTITSAIPMRRARSLSSRAAAAAALQAAGYPPAQLAELVGGVRAWDLQVRWVHWLVGAGRVGDVKVCPSRKSGGRLSCLGSAACWLACGCRARCEPFMSCGLLASLGVFWGCLPCLILAGNLGLHLLLHPHLAVPTGWPAAGAGRLQRQEQRRAGVVDSQQLT